MTVENKSWEALQMAHKILLILDGKERVVSVSALNIANELYAHSPQSARLYEEWYEKNSMIIKALEKIINDYDY